MSKVKILVYNVKADIVYLELDKQCFDSNGKLKDSEKLKLTNQGYFYFDGKKKFGIE